MASSLKAVDDLIPDTTVALASSSNGRTSGKPWKVRKSATVYALLLSFSNIAKNSWFLSRSHIPNGVKAKSWQDRMEKTKKETAIKKLQTDLKNEKQAEITQYGWRFRGILRALTRYLLGDDRLPWNAKRPWKNDED